MKEPRKERNLKFEADKWYLDFTFKGKRIRQFGGYTKDQARNTLVKLKSELLDVARGFKKPASADVPFEKFADEFLELYSKQNKRSWKNDEASLENLKRFFKGETLSTIGPEEIERYKVQRAAMTKKTGKKKEARKISPATVNRELACLKTLLNKGVEWGKLEKSPAARVKKLKENNSRERILSGLEARRLVECASSSIRPVLVVALNTGMRRNEILSLRWQDVDFGKGFILIEDSKSGRARKVPMNLAVFETLKGLPQKSEYVFFNPETETHVKDIKTGFKSACKEAGVKGLRLHDLRHTPASWMIEAGADLVTVSKILGHSSIQMTMRYAHPTPENMRLAVEKLAGFLDQTRQKVDKPSEQAAITKPVNRSKLDN